MQRLVVTGAALLCAFSVTSTPAAMVEAGLRNISGTTWEYSYTLNNELASVIEEFSVFFDLGAYSNLMVMASPGDWDSIAIQPDAALPDDGFFDALSLTGGLAPGATVSGFVLRFDYLLAGAPGAQLFHIVDPVSFDTLYTGTTQVIPLPPAVFMLLGALLSLGVFRGRAARA